MPGDANGDPPVRHRRRSRRNRITHAYQDRLAHTWVVVLQRFRDYIVAGGSAASPKESHVKP
jgi:hypothetical protein